MSKKNKLTPEAKKALENILGERWVITDRASMSGYAYDCGVGRIPAKAAFSELWPLAVVLPSSTEEVAAILKYCYAHGMDYRAHSTGYGSSSNISNANSLSIDLRRMDHMEIIPEDRMAIIGPYATAGKLQAEALKHGMTCHIVGAGPAHSPLASATALIGVGISSQGTSANVRNLLSWEWVSPKGEIVRGGTSADGDTWFAGEGPGPGTRGLLRGFMGSAGGLGVFTKIGYKLYPVPVKGPIKNSGKFPQIGTPLPKNWGLYQAVWPDWNKVQEASFELLQDDLCFTLLRMPPDHLGWTVTGTNAEYCSKFKEGSLPPLARLENDKNWTILTTAYSEDEHAWKKDVIADIVERTGGKILELSQQEEDVMCHALLTSQYVPRVLRPASSIATSFGVLDSFHFLPRAIEGGERVLRGENKHGGKLNEGSREEQWVWPTEGRYMWAENILNFNSFDDKSREVAAMCFLDHYNEHWKNEGSLGVECLTIGPLMDLQGEKIGAPQRHIRKIKNHFDPDNRAVSKGYITPSIPKLAEKILPPLRPVLWSQPVLKMMSKMVAKKGM